MNRAEQKSVFFVPPADSRPVSTRMPSTAPDTRYRNKPIFWNDISPEPDRATRKCMGCQMLTMFCVGLPAGSKAVHEGKTRVDLCREVAFRKLVDRSRIGLLW